MIQALMKYRDFLLIAAISPLLFSFFSPAWCAESGNSGVVKIAADTLTMENRSSTYRAAGNVRAFRDGLSLLADSIIYRATENEAIAEGGVVMEKDGDTLRGDRLSLNLETEQGEMTNGNLFFKKNNLHVRSAKVAKVGKSDYRLERGTFTTCDGDSPSWRFTASAIEVSLEEYASGRNAIFYVGNVPLFYTPYILFPVKRERQSGFLMPRIGNSTKKGFSLDLPYYWAISASQDATFDLDVQSKRGIGAGLDYRFMRRRGSEGTLRAYGIHDTEQERFRGDFTGKQREMFSDTVSMISTISLVSDRDFYRDYGETAGEYNRQLLESSVALSKRWQRYGLTGELRYLQDLDAPNNRASLQRLPTVTFTGVGEKLGTTPFFFSLDSAATNFQRTEGVSGQRFDLHPKLALYRQAGIFDLAMYAGYRERLYNAYGADAGRGSHAAGMADAAATVSAQFARIYDAQWGGVRRIRHLLLPEVGYIYGETKSQEQLPFFDYDDRPVGQSMAVWSLASYVTGKLQQADGPPQYRDLLYLKLSQGYQFSGSRRDLLTLVDEGRPLTDLRLESRFTPTSEMSLTMDSRFNTYQARLSTVSLWANFADKAGNLAGVGYQFAREEIEYLEGKLGVALVKPFVFNYTSRYSFDRGNFLESRYALEYKHQCWSVILSYSDRPDNRQFMVNFALAGIGALGPVKAF